MFDNSSQNSLARELGKYISIEIDPKASHKHNRQGTNWLREADLSKVSWLAWGIVVDSIAYLHLYKVQLENNYTLWCSFGSQTSLNVTGARQLNTLSIGSMVYVIMHPQGKTGTIVTVDPSYIFNPLNHRSDYISQASRCGATVDSAYKVPFGFNMNGGTTNYSAGRPIDGLPNAGEWGAVTETGLLVFLDSFMFQARVDEETGLWLFYHDQLTRLGGHNLELRSSVSHREEYDDQGELNTKQGFCPYYSESLGVLAYGTGNNLSRSYTLEQTQGSNPEYANLEPVQDDQQPFYRFMNFNGYLGQGKHEFLCLPPLAASQSQVNQYSIEQNFIGVYASSVAMDGSVNLRSAKKIVITKRPSIPVPKEMIRPEDQRGDNNTNYKAAGMLGTGPAHKIIDGPVLNGSETAPRNEVTTAVIEDTISFSDWERLHPFYYHSRDWYLYDEGASNTIGTVSVPVFGNLQCNQDLAVPTPVNLYVDERYKTANYYPNESIFTMLDDGGIVISDGWGSEIIMTGGNIKFSAAGDIWMQPGKNFNVWAGWDIINKAYNSVDVTTTRRDIRIKAQHDLLMLAGNDDCGGVLIESRATCPMFDVNEIGEDMTLSGITMKAKNSYIMSTAQKQYHRTVYSGSTDGEGDIVFNAASNIRSKASYIYNDATNAIMDFVGDAVYEQWPDYTMIPNYLGVNGPVDVYDCLTVGDWIRSTDGHIATGLASDYANLVPTLDGTNLTNAAIGLNNITAREITTATYPTQYFGAGVFSYMDGILNNVLFSLRTKEQYRTQGGFMLFENRWQQIARLTSQIDGTHVCTWTEQPVVGYGATTTYPHPAIDYWLNSSCWRTINPVLYDTVDGKAVAKSSIYETAVLNASVASVLDGTYPIIMKI